jgi:hypothetical protein
MAKRPKVPLGSLSVYDRERREVKSRRAEPRRSDFLDGMLGALAAERPRFPVEMLVGSEGFIMPGDTIICTADGGRDDCGRPVDVPLAGHRYIVDSFYIAPYGMGVVLSNVDGTPLDNYPYRGYVFISICVRYDRAFEMKAYFKPDTEYDD